MPNGRPEDLLKTRLDYAWGWWQFHGKQRTDMFNYYLIITGILANAYVGVWKDSRLGLGTGVALLGILASIGFLLLDIRNRQQLDAANEALKTIQNDGLGVTLANIGPPAVHPSWIGPLVTHRFVFRAIELLVAAGWFTAIVAAYRTQ
jgi:hypothetical protein